MHKFSSILFCGLLALGLSHAAADERTDAVLAGIRTHDGQITSINVHVAVDIGVVDGKGKEQITADWMAKGKKELLTKHWAGETEVAAFDGKMNRMLSLSSDPTIPPNASTLPVDRAVFANKSVYPNGFTARDVWEQELLLLITSGRAAINAAPVNYEGRSCVEIIGRLKTKALDGDDGPGFRVLLDPQSGYMPRYLEEYLADANGKVTVRNIMDQYVLSEVQKGIWYPTSLRQRSLQLNSAGEWDTIVVNQVTASKLELNVDIADEQFDLKFPANIRVVDMSRPPGRGRRGGRGTTGPAN